MAIAPFQGKRDILVHQLREAILTGHYAVGERLRQDEVARRFGVSATPVREALRILEAQGLVRHEAHRGVTVADLAGTFDQVYRLREALECLAVEMAVERMTDQRAAHLFQIVERIERAIEAQDEEARHDAHTAFHTYLYDGCGFPALVEQIRLVWRQFPWDELLTLPGLASVQDHREIAALAATRNPKEAAERLRRHLDSVRQAIAVGPQAVRVTPLVGAVASNG